MSGINSTFNYVVTQHKIWACFSISTVSSYPSPFNPLNLSSAKYGFHWISPSSQLQQNFRRLVLKFFQNRKCERWREKKAETITVSPITFGIHHPMIQQAPQFMSAHLALAFHGLHSVLLTKVIVPGEIFNTSWEQLVMRRPFLHLHISLLI